MYLIRGQNNIKLFKKRFPEVSLSATIGNFDGMHLGHKAILEKVKKNAKKKIFLLWLYLPSLMPLSISLKLIILLHRQE